MKAIEFISIWKSVLFGAVIGIMIFHFFTCKSTNPEIIYTPPEMQPIIDEVEKAPELDKAPELKQKISSALKECRDYSESCYNKNIELNDRVAKLERIVREQQEELDTWRSIKRFIYWSIAIIVGSIIIFFVWQFRGIIFKAAGIP